MTKENSKSILKILALFLTLLALLSTLFTPLLSGLQANASSYTLTDSLVQNESGSWVTSGGKWLDRWLNYNCYAFAIERFEYPQKYSSYERIQYQPGNFSHNTELNITRKSAEYIANAVKDDLVAIGHEESSISISTAIPTVNSNQQLICIRTSSANALNWDYHFMRYDSETNAWYHKPGPSAILKYKYTPTNDRSWKAEYYDENGAHSNNVTYNSTIYFIKYNKNIFDPTRESTINISAGKDTMIEINCSTSTTGHFVVTANSSIKAKLYNDRMNEIATFNGTTTINELRTLTAGKYYLQVMFASTSTSGSIKSSFYTHVDGERCIICNHGIGGQHSYDASYVWKNDKNHLAKCECGATKLKGHGVMAGSFVGGYATCIQCGGRASVGFVDPGPFSNTTLPCSANGSYILPNGVIVLVEADIAAFLQGTLVFTQGTLLNIAA